MIRRIRRWWLRNFGAFEVRDEITGERTIWRYVECDECDGNGNVDCDDGLDGVTRSCPNCVY